MIDALLFSVKDAVCKSSGYDDRTCDVRADGRPPPSCGDVFLAIHQSSAHSEMDNALDEYLGFDLTLTYRITVPLDRLGDQELASRLARRPGPRGQPSHNARLDRLKSFLHMNWGVIQDANNLMSQMATEEIIVFGFCEPMRYVNRDLPHFEGGAWFEADDAADNVGLVGVLHFDRARRLEPISYFF